MPPKAEIEWTQGNLRIYDDGSYAEGSPHSFFLSITTDGDRVIIKGLRVDDERFTWQHMKAIERALWIQGFRVAEWERVHGRGRRSYMIRQRRSEGLHGQPQYIL